MRFKGLDLNLLLALDALLETRSVSRAAERLNLSQPAMSAALGHLRTYFRDDILAVHGKRMHPTSFALSLAPMLDDCLRNVESLVSSKTSFEPATSRRMFSIVASDYIIVAVLAHLVAKIAKTAPNIRIKLMATAEDSTRKFIEGDVDLLIAPEGFHEPAFPADILFSERYVVVGWDQNPIFKRKLREEDIFAVGHIAVSIGPNLVDSFADRQLIALGKKRVIEVTSPVFTVLPWLLQGTSRVTLMHERLAHAMARHFPVAYAPLPFAFPMMAELVQYHPAHVDDEGLTWLRHQLQEAAATTNPVRTKSVQTAETNVNSEIHSEQKRIAVSAQRRRPKAQ